MRTSQTHPLRIADVEAGMTPGVVGITFCPGKQGASFSGSAWHRDLATDLDAIKAWGAATVVTLIEPHEFEMLNVRQLGPQVFARGMQWLHMPIVDVQPPSLSFEREWAIHGARLIEDLQQGAKVLVHCRGGLGRAGTVASLLLLGCGLTAEQAVQQVRAARPGAIETSAQLAYVYAAAGQLIAAGASR